MNNTIKEFRKLPKNEQVYTVFHEGRELLHRNQEDYLIKLYTVHDLYVEIWYNSAKNVIEKIEVIDEKDLINIYDDEIHLSQLIKK